MKKSRTYEQTETAQARAVAFAENVLEDSDLADELDSLTPEEYADRKGITITNPVRRITTMANGNGNGSMTKGDMADCLDQIEDILTDAYTPEASREDLAAAIGDALDVIQGNAPDDTDGDDSDDDDSGNPRRAWPAEAVTDPAQRYRANAHPPPGERICCFCGSRTDMQIAHIDGHEEHNESANLAWSCRSCNGRMAHVLKRAGLGRRTAQYNPGTRGATSLGQWILAVQSMKGESDAMSVRDAVAMVKATPASRRSEFGYQIWERRRQHGTDKTGVPF